MKVYGYSPFGYEGSLVTVEADLRHGIPAVDIVGFADGSVKESRERMKDAIKNSGFEFPQERVLISLAPADLRKEGAGFDLAMAMAVLYAQNPVVHATDSLLCYAELELSGRLRPVRGTYAALESALSHGITKAIVPFSVPDAEIPDGITVLRARTLGEAWRIATIADDGTAPKAPARPAECGIEFPVTYEEGTIDGIKKPDFFKTDFSVGLFEMAVCKPRGIAQNSFFIKTFTEDFFSVAENRKCRFYKPSASHVASFVFISSRAFFICPGNQFIGAIIFSFSLDKS